MFHEAGTSPQAPVAVRKHDRQGLGGFREIGEGKRDDRDDSNMFFLMGVQRTFCLEGGRVEAQQRKLGG